MFIAMLFVALVATDQSAGATKLGSFFSVDKQVEITRASQLDELVGALDASPEDESVHDKRTRLALHHLNKMINTNKDNVCRLAKINQIRAFYTQFVDKNSLAEQDEPKLAKFVQNLFLSYGFGVSRLCKTSMVSSLLSASQRLLNKHDFQQIASWTSESGPLSKVLKAPNDVDDLVLPEDILAVLREKAEKKGKTLPSAVEKLPVALQSATSRNIRKVQAVCERRFRPIYGQLILPLVSLSRIGLNYKSSLHKQQMKTNKDVHLWYRIVYLCESLATVDVLDQPDVAAIDADKKTVRVLAAEEADELRSKQEPGQPDQEDVGVKVDFQVDDHRGLDDLIVDQQDRSLQKLVDKFEAHRSEVRRMRSKVVKQMMNIMKGHLKGHKVSIVKGLFKKSSGQSMNEGLIKAVDEYFDQNDVSPGGGHVRVKRWVADFFLTILAYSPILIPIGCIVFLALLVG